MRWVTEAPTQKRLWVNITPTPQSNVVPPTSLSGMASSALECASSPSIVTLREPLNDSLSIPACNPTLRVPFSIFFFHANCASAVVLRYRPILSACRTTPTPQRRPRNLKGMSAMAPNVMGACLMPSHCRRLPAVMWIKSMFPTAPAL